MMHYASRIGFQMEVEPSASDVLWEHQQKITPPYSEYALWESDSNGYDKLFSKEIVKNPDSGPKPYTTLQVTLYTQDKLIFI